VARRTLVQFWTKHSDSEAGLRHWFKVAEAAQWGSTADVQAAFSKAKVLNAERVRFDVGGGAYRLIVAFDFPRGAAFIKFVGTHAAYDRVDALTVELYRG
jgi:mRNA interferase HigB